VKDPNPKTTELPKTTKNPIPDEDAVKQAEKAVREQFKKEYAKKLPADSVALAEKLLQLAIDTKDDMTARYVLLCEARDLAAGGGKALLALKAVDELTEGFAIDTLETKQAALIAVGKIPLGKESSRELMEAALGVVAAL